MNQPMKSIIRTSCLCALALVITGCTGNLLRSKVDEPALYVLHATNVPTASVAYPVTLRVTQPNATPGLGSDRIAVLRQHTLDYFAGARWPDTAAQVAQSYLVDYLHSTGGFKNVVSDRVAVDADYSVALELRDFQAEYTGTAAPVIHVTLSGALMDIKQRQTVTVLHATSSVTASDNRLDAVINAFDKAMQQTSSELAAQIQKAVGNR